MALPSKKAQEQMEKHLNVLRLQFIESLKQKETDLEDAICDIAAFGPDKDRLTRIYYVAHSLVGTAPTYGFHALARSAETVEGMMDLSFTPDQGAGVSPDLLLLATDELGEAIRATLAASAKK